MRAVLDLLFDWLLFGFGVPILIGAGFALLSDEFRAFKAARVCFYLATAWIYGKVLMWSWLSTGSFRLRAFVVFVVFGLVGIAVMEALRLTVKRESPPLRSSPIEESPPPLAPPAGSRPHHRKAADLVIRFIEGTPPYCVTRKPYTVYRIGIVNSGDVLAENVSVRLVNILPRPRDSMYGADFPYPLFTSTGNEFARINPHEEELFSLAQTWTAGDGRLIVSGINKKSFVTPVNDPISIDHDESWNLDLRATAGNAQPKEIKLEMRVKEGSVILASPSARLPQ